MLTFVRIPLNSPFRLNKVTNQYLVSPSGLSMKPIGNVPFFLEGHTELTHITQNQNMVKTLFRTSRRWSKVDMFSKTAGQSKTDQLLGTICRSCNMRSGLLWWKVVENQIWHFGFSCPQCKECLSAAQLLQAVFKYATPTDTASLSKCSLVGMNTNQVQYPFCTSTRQYILTCYMLDNFMWHHYLGRTVYVFVYCKNCCLPLNFSESRQ